MSKTKKIVEASRSWMLMVSADHFDRDFVANALQNYRYIGQMEIGEKRGFRHWQIFIDNPSTAGAIRFDTLRNAFPANFGGSVDIEAYDKTRGTKLQCFNYVSKSKTAVEGTKISRGDWSKEENMLVVQVKQRDRAEYLAGLAFRATIGGESVAKICSEMSLEDSRKYRDELNKRQLDYLNLTMSNDTRQLTVNYLSGESRIGKTTYLRKMLGNDVYRVSNYRREPWDQYIGQTKIIIDEFRSQIDFSEMLNILDAHPVILAARYNNKFFAANEIWVVSNRTIEQQYEHERKNFPADWEAFYARFHNVFRMNERNQPFELVATPAANQKAKFAKPEPAKLLLPDYDSDDIDNLPF